MNEHTRPQCEFEDTSAADIIDGLGTLRGRSGQGVFVPAPGDGPDDPLSWALQEISNAAQALDPHEKRRLCTDAVLNARRALACLDEWYVERDLARWCTDSPNTPKEQAEFLMRRGIIDELTSNVLERAILKRNRVEHTFVAPDLDTAEDIVELLRRTMSAVRNQSDPSVAPWIFGSFLGGYCYAKGRVGVNFQGWCEPLAVFSRSQPRPWVGLVLPDGPTKAVVRRAYLDTTTVNELLELISLAEQKYGHPSSFMSNEVGMLMEREMGIV